MENTYVQCTLNVCLHVKFPLLLIVIITARKRSFGQGNIFRNVCQEFCPRGGGCASWGACVDREVCMVGGGGCLWPGEACVVGGVHAQGASMPGEVRAWGACVSGGKGACVGRGHMWQRGGACMAKGACVVKVGVHGIHAPPLRNTAGQCAGGTHPTGMHSCLALCQVRTHSACYSHRHHWYNSKRKRWVITDTLRVNRP